MELVNAVLTPSTESSRSMLCDGTCFVSFVVQKNLGVGLQLHKFSIVNSGGLRAS